MIATNSLLAEKAVATFLDRRERGGLFGVLDQEGLVYRHGKETDGRRPLVTAAWRVHVRRGMEGALLHDLNHFVALVLEREGGYAGIDPHLSMAVARRTVAAHQARRVVLTDTCAETMRSGKVTFEPAMHATYLGMVSKNHTGKQRVTVAMLDAAVQREHLADNVDVSVELGHVPPDQRRQVPLAHGAVTASIIGSLAPTARILVYPVAGGRPPDLANESQVMWSIQSAVAAQVDVIVMCLALRSEVDTAQRWSLEMVMTGVGDKPVMIASAGNRDRRSSSPPGRFPGIHREVIMVSAVDKDRRRPAYSRFELRGPSKPALHVVAPGGGDEVRGGSQEHSVSVGRCVFVGTSVATAYAAGVIARSIASAAMVPRTAKELRRTLETAADPIKEWDDDVQQCKGLIRQFD